MKVSIIVVEIHIIMNQNIIVILTLKLPATITVYYSSMCIQLWTQFPQRELSRYYMSVLVYLHVSIEICNQLLVVISIQKWTFCP